jgi:hypothetical protein
LIYLLDFFVIPSASEESHDAITIHYPCNRINILCILITSGILPLRFPPRLHSESTQGQDDKMGESVCIMK